jgi:FixJ family two-component response regulator
VLREAKALYPALGVVMLTGVLDEHIGRQALREGAFDYVTKPVNLRYLDLVVWYTLATMTIA